ncbi:uncharacterized protein LOC125035970 isoform X2 [Penaeus chinensis]|uniref:uncharacterized protein LOC125035970 isoform X2 n=1 Tax=Penaeus chinensis TaxID=139456 RepID=UPI001FB682FC|nr:uncharacterized protein LOC125035970 isoform X2 [Penaeus chinensis]
MTLHMTFQEICTRQEIGFVCDNESMAPLTRRESFNDLVIKLASKCEMNIVFLTGARNKVLHFTLDVVPEDPVHGTAVTVTKSKGRRGSEYPKGYEAVAAACQQVVANGYHGLHAIAKLDKSNMPDNASRKMYTFAQFVNFLVHGIEAYFMFAKANEQFVLNAMNLWETMEDLMMDGCYIVMAWQYEEDPRKVSDDVPRTPLSSFINNIKEPEPLPVAEPVQPVVVKETKKQVTTTTIRSSSTTTKGGKRGRRSIAARIQEASEASTDEEDTEISFKIKPDINKTPEIQYHPDITINSAESVLEKTSPRREQKQSPKRPVSERLNISPKKSKSMEVEEPAATISKEDTMLEDFTFGFDKPEVKSTARKSTARKSTARKSMVPDWPEEQKEDILYFFDNLNPSQTEQSRIALTCKYVSMKYSREFSSKTLYQWVQKKGRSVSTEVTNYELPESKHQETTLTFFRSLDPNLSEASRISFTCKFMQTQYGVSVTSKNLYDWLNDKGKKSTRRR